MNERLAEVFRSMSLYDLQDLRDRNAEYAEQCHRNAEWMDNTVKQMDEEIARRRCENG